MAFFIGMIALTHAAEPDGHDAVPDGDWTLWIATALIVVSALLLEYIIKGYLRNMKAKKEYRSIGAQTDRQGQGGNLFEERHDYYAEYTTFGICYFFPGRLNEVAVTGSGEKYHRKTCGHIRGFSLHVKTARDKEPEAQSGVIFCVKNGALPQAP